MRHGRRARRETSLPRPVQWKLVSAIPPSCTSLVCSEICEASIQQEDRLEQTGLARGVLAINQVSLARLQDDIGQAADAGRLEPGDGRGQGPGSSEAHRHDYVQGVTAISFLQQRTAVGIRQ